MLARDGGGLKGQLTRGAAGSFALKILSALLGLVMTALFARLLGPDGLGRYAFAWSLVVLLAVPASLGHPNMAIRFVAAYRARGQWSLMRGFMTASSIAMLAASLLVMAVAGVVLAARADSIAPASLSVMLVALLLLPLRPQQVFAEGAIRGLGRVVTAQVPEAVGRHLVVLVLLGIAWLAGWVPGSLTPAGLMAMQLVSLAIILGVTVYLLQRATPAEAKGVRRERETAAWVRSGVPLLLVAVIGGLNGQLNLLATGWLASAEDTGIYRVANQSATLINFVLMSTNMAMAPAVAALHARGERGRLQRALTASARVVLLASLPLAIFLVLFAGWFLGFAFGDEFSRGGTALAVMALGQLVNAGAGPVGLVLNMTGNERFSAYGLAVAVVANAVLCVILIPPFGVTGSAVAFTVSTITWNVLLYALVLRRTGLHCGAWLPRVSRG